MTARVPWAWPLLRRPVSRFFDRQAPGWDARVGDEAESVAPLMAAVDELGVQPRRILDVGTGTGRAARTLARRFPDAQVTGIDVSPAMIEQAARDDLGGRVRFAVADVRGFDGGPFDLVTHVNVPVLFSDLARITAPGGLVVVATTMGPRTPFFTSDAALRRGFSRAGLRVEGSGHAGQGTWLAARRPPA